MAHAFHGTFYLENVAFNEPWETLSEAEPRKMLLLYSKGSEGQFS